MNIPPFQSQANQWSLFLDPSDDRERHIALLSEQIEAIAERLMDKDSYIGWSEEDVLRVMRREGNALYVFHQSLNNLLQPRPSPKP